MTTGDDWARRQRALVTAHGSRAAGVERRPAKIRWWTAATGARRVDLAGALARLWSGRGSGTEPVFVALYEVADPIGTRPFLVVRVAPDSFAEAAGRAVVTLVGGAAPDGTLLIETRLGPVVPVEPPAAPGDAAPTWSEVDAGP